MRQLRARQPATRAPHSQDRRIRHSRIRTARETGEPMLDRERTPAESRYRCPLRSTSLCAGDAVCLVCLVGVVIGYLMYAAELLSKHGLRASTPKQISLDALTIALLTLQAVVAGMAASLLWRRWQWRHHGRWVKQRLHGFPQTGFDAILVTAAYIALFGPGCQAFGKIPALPADGAKWTLAVLLWLRAFMAYRVSRRSWRQLETHVACAECGYILTGLESPRCPECGSQLGPVRTIRLSKLTGRVR